MGVKDGAGIKAVKVHGINPFCCVSQLQLLFLLDSIILGAEQFAIADGRKETDNQLFAQIGGKGEGRGPACGKDPAQYHQYLSGPAGQETTGKGDREGAVPAGQINKSTFYAHYQDLYALSDELETQVVEQVDGGHRPARGRVRAS